jgi:hypothetical protein
MGEIIKKYGETFYEAVSLSKDDLLYIFKGNEKAINTINKMTDEDFSYLADKYGEALMEVAGWEEILKMEFVSHFMGKDSLIKD